MTVQINTTTQDDARDVYQQIESTITDSAQPEPDKAELMSRLDNVFDTLDSLLGELGLSE